MTLSIDGQLSSGGASWHHKGGHGHGSPAVAAKATGSPAAASPAGSTSSTGLQGFATELQSVLVGLQTGSNAAATPSAPVAAAAAGTGYAGSASGSAPAVAGPLAGMADRLQKLLHGLDGSSATATGDTNSADPLHSVLGKLQASLSQALQSYATTANTPTSSLLS